MEKVKLGSGLELDIIVGGILVDSDTAVIKFLPGDNSLDSLNTLLSDQGETQKITLLSEGGETLAVYNGYTKLQSVSLEPDAVIGHTQDGGQTEIRGKLVTAVLGRPDLIEQRITSLESQMTDTQMALCEIYEGMV